jgi:uncharacterized protein
MPSDHMMRPAFALGLWGALCLAAAFYGNWSGYGARPFAITLGTFAVLLAGEIWLAAPAIAKSLARASGPQGGVLLALWPLAAWLLYALGTRSIAGAGRVAMAMAYALVPVLLAASAHKSKPGAWQDYVAMATIFLPYKMGWLTRLFPGGALPLARVLPLLFALNVALATFLFVRQMDGVGYSVGWRASWAGAVALSLVGITAIDIPLGMALHFLRFGPGAARWSSLPVVLLGTFILTAWPEEFLFRGLLQNALRKTLRSENGGWLAASVIFGLTHIANGGFPNWRYALLASLAGLGYGFAWRKTGSIFPAAIVHALVDVTWHFLFPST